MFEIRNSYLYILGIKICYMRGASKGYEDTFSKEDYIFDENQLKKLDIVWINGDMSDMNSLKKITLRNKCRKLI